MNAGERIQELIAHYGMNAKTFSEFCGYDRPQVMYDIIKGKTRNISAAMCDRITSALPDVNRTWLLTGDGNMIASSADEQVEAVAAKPAHMVPLIPMSALAGPIKSYYEPGVALTNCELIITPNPMAEMALPVSGDSMEPVFADGSVIFVKRINEAAFIPWGHPMVIDTENGVFIKNVMPDDLDTKYIWAESINPKYPRMHIPKTSIYGIYRVLNVQKSFTIM